MSAATGSGMNLRKPRSSIVILQTNHLGILLHDTSGRDTHRIPVLLDPKHRHRAPHLLAYTVGERLCTC
jgi:hypothetical protein